MQPGTPSAWPNVLAAVLFPAAALSSWDSPSAATVSSTVRFPHLEWEPRVGWLDVRDFGAAGDGSSDDSLPLQAAFRNMTHGSTLFIPSGTYVLRGTLNLTHVIGGMIIGNGVSTQLEWHGAVNGTMVHSDSSPGVRWVGLSWNGRGIAAIGTNHDSLHTYETEIIHEAETWTGFTKFAAVTSLSHRVATAETLWRNCYFGHSEVGLRLSYFNDYDHTIDGCWFDSNGIGIDSLAGMFYVRNTRFDNSSVADLNQGVPWAVSSARRVVSVGSARFLIAETPYGGGKVKVVRPTTQFGFLSCDAHAT